MCQIEIIKNVHNQTKINLQNKDILLFEIKARKASQS